MQFKAGSFVVAIFDDDALLFVQAGKLGFHAYWQKGGGRRLDIWREGGAVLARLGALRIIAGR